MALTAALMKAAPFAVLTLVAATLAACIVEPAGYYGRGEEAYYARPAPFYVAPGTYYGQRRSYWYRHGWRGGGWHGGGWQGGGWHGGDDR